MNDTQAGEVHRLLNELADAWGVAPVTAFAGAPPGTHPCDLMSECRSVIVLALKHLDCFACSRNLDAQAYTQDIVNGEMLRRSYRLARWIEESGHQAFPIVASAALRPYSVAPGGSWPTLSLRHAAERAGLGRIGWNALLLTPAFGPRVQLAAILTDAELPPTGSDIPNPCVRCGECIRACPGGALHAPSDPQSYRPVDAERCRGFRRAHGGQSPLGYANACGLCRAVCPVGRRKSFQPTKSCPPIEHPVLLGADRFIPDDRLVYKQVNGAELALFLFRPKPAPVGSPRPGILFFFGGGWQGGSPSQFFPHCAYLASRGMVAMSAEYRVSSVHGTTPFESVADAKSALRWVRRHAEQLGLDPNRLAAGGGSAGGHLAAAAALLRSFDEPGEDVTVSCRPDALVLFNPALDNGPGGAGYARVQSRWREFSPHHNVALGAPPAALFLGTEDKVIPVATALEFQRRMADAGALCEVWLYEGCSHGFFNYRGGTNPWFGATLYDADRFLASLKFLEGPPAFPRPEVPHRRLTDGGKAGECP